MIKFTGTDGEVIETADEADQDALVELGFTPQDPSYPADSVTPDEPTTETPAANTPIEPTEQLTPEDWTKTYEPIPADHILVLDKDGNDGIIPQGKLDDAIAKGFEPALEFVTKDGELTTVRRKDYDAAKSQGLTELPIWFAQQDARQFGDTVPAYKVPGYGAADTAMYGLAGDIKGVESAMRGGSASKAREEWRQSSNTAKQESPWLYTGGQALGLMATGGIGALASKAKPALSSLPAIIVQGGATGGASAFGEGEGSASERIKNIPSGAATGVGVNTAFFGGGAALKKLGNRLLGSPEELAYRATGAMQANKRQLGNKQPEQVGRAMLEEKVIGWLPRSKETLATRANTRIGSIEELNDKMLIDTAKSGGKVSTRSIVTDLGDKSSSYMNQLPTSNEEIAKAISREREGILRQHGIFDPETGNVVHVKSMSPQQAVELKRGYSQDKNYVPGNVVDPRKQAEKETASTIREQIIKDMQSKIGGDKAAEYASNNLRQGNLISARKIMEDQIFRDKNRRRMGLTDWQAITAGAAGSGAAGTVVGGPAVGGITTGAYLTKKLVEAFGDQMGAKIGYEYGKLSKTMGYKLARDEIARRFGAKAGEIISPQEQEQQ